MSTLNLKEIKTKLINSPRSTRSLYEKNKERIDELYPDIENYSEKMFLIKEDLKTAPKCICGKSKAFFRFSSGYHSTCGNSKCKNISKSQKTKKTNLEKYGAECVFANEKVKQKIKNKMLEKYGSNSSLGNQEVREKAKKTMIEKYGNAHALQNKSIKEKRKRTMESLYGEDGYLHTKKWKSKMIEKYGTTNAMLIPEIKEKCRKTQIENKLKLLIEKIEETNKKYIGVNLESGHERIELQCMDCDKLFSINRNGLNHYLRSSKDCCPKCNYSNRFRSTGEKELYDWISKEFADLNIDANRKFRKHEVDVYIDELNLAIEYNGLYWHSEIHKNPKYHQDKSIDFKKIGINLVHIWEDDWKHKTEIVKSIIRSKIKSERIGARKTAVKKLSSKEAKEFHEKFHLDGYANSSIHIGLYYNEELISLASFAKTRFKKWAEWELVRYTIKEQYSITGGFSKILKQFIQDLNPKDLVSYKKLDLGSNNFYESVGFEKIGTTPPGYFWIVDDIRINRHNFMRSKLKGIKEAQTEVEFMHEKGYSRIWDSGSEIFYRKFRSDDI